MDLNEQQGQWILQASLVHRETTQQASKLLFTELIQSDASFTGHLRSENHVEVVVKHEYPKSPDQVLARFLDSDYIKEKYAAIGAKNIQVMENSVQKSVHKTLVSREVDSDVPSFAKKIFKSTNTVLETNEWTLNDGSTKKCVYVVDIKGTPVKVTGHIILRDARTAGHCEHEISAKIEVKIPFIGKKIAALVAKQTQKSLAREFEFNSKQFA
jgi:hypothetical protein